MSAQHDFEYNKLVYTQAEFKQMTNISRATQLELRKAGKLKYCILPGQRIGYRPHHIEAYLRDAEKESANG